MQRSERQLAVIDVIRLDRIGSNHEIRQRTLADWLMSGRTRRGRCFLSEPDLAGIPLPQTVSHPPTSLNPQSDLWSSLAPLYALLV